MKLILTGGTGFIGKALTEALIRRGHDLTVLTRRQAKADEPRVKPFYLYWDPPAGGVWEKAVQSADGIINLAGEPVAKKSWTDAQKKKILESRVLTTRAIVQAMEGNEAKPKFLINASAIGYYGDRKDEVLTEYALPGNGFLAEVCKAWEAEADRAETSGNRVVILRFGMVLEKDGGALGKMLPVFRYGLGGPLGDGKQWVSWIHRRDLIELILFSADTASVRGALNATAPVPVRMKEFAKALGSVLHRPAIFPAPAFLLKKVLGEMSELMLSSQKALPLKAQECGFRFAFPVLNEALASCLKT